MLSFRKRASKVSIVTANKSMSLFVVKLHKGKELQQAQQISLDSVVQIFPAVYTAM